MPSFMRSDGWRVDAAALATMAACGAPEQHSAVLGTVRAVYLPWLENTARHLQQLIRENGRDCFQARQADRNRCGTAHIVCGWTADGCCPAVGGEASGGWN